MSHKRPPISGQKSPPLPPPPPPPPQFISRSMPPRSMPRSMPRSISRSMLPPRSMPWSMPRSIPPPRSPLHTTKKRTISPSSPPKKKVKKDVLIKKWIQEHHWGNISLWNKTNYVQEITNIFKDSNLSEFQKQNIFECILLKNLGQLRRNNYLRESLCKTNIVSRLIRLNWTLYKVEYYITTDIKYNGRCCNIWIYSTNICCDKHKKYVCAKPSFKL